MQWSILAAAGFAFLICIIICPLFIKILRKMQFGQYVREDGPFRHRSKSGTPTAGGVVFLLAAIMAVLPVVLLQPPADWGTGDWQQPALILVVALGSGLIGWLDDFAKFSHSQSLGLKARSKILGQVFVALLFTGGLALCGLYSTEIIVPFTGRVIDLQLFYPLFVVVMIMATTNGVNLTDGIDGLAAGTTIIALLAFMYIAVEGQQTGVAIMAAALIGGCFGFLVYNLHPAHIFMGDAGSLALGGALAAAAILVKQELLLIIIGAVFVIEALSVILQVFFYKLMGRRIFLMAPLHHHYELKGWSEWQVVTGFWGLAFISAVIGLIGFWI